MLLGLLLYISVTILAKSNQMIYKINKIHENSIEKQPSTMLGHRSVGLHINLQPNDPYSTQSERDK